MLLVSSGSIQLSVASTSTIRYAPPSMDIAGTVKFVAATRSPKASVRVDESTRMSAASRVASVDTQRSVTTVVAVIVPWFV